MKIQPTAGAPGTTVRIVVTGCNDPSGENHAISFNNDVQNMAARSDPNTVRSIHDTQQGPRLAATYTIVSGDATGGVGTFFAQCGRTLRAVKFQVTD